MSTIQIDTTIDTRQLEKDLARAQKSVEKLKKEYDAATAKLGGTADDLEPAVMRIQELIQKAKEYKEILAQPSDTSRGKGTWVESSAGISAQAELRMNAQRELPGIEAEIEQLKAKIEKARPSVQKMQNDFAQTKEQLEAATKSADDLAERLDRARADKFARDLEEARAAINAGGGANGNVFAQAANKVGEMGTAFRKNRGAVEKFTRRIGNLAKRVLIFSVITTALRHMRSALSEVAKENEEATQAFSDLKNAALIMARPLVSAVMPVLITLANLATRAALAIGNLFARFTGKSLSDFVKGTKKASSASKSTGRSMASFDTVQTIGNSGSGGGAGSDGIDINKYKSGLDELMTYLSGALLALGLILALSGVNLPLGLALMALGAAGLASEIALNWGAMEKPLKNALNNVLLIAAGALLAIGILLCATGANIPLGIGLIVLGAAALAAAVAINWKSLDDPVQQSLNGIAKIAAGALLALGIILTVTGVSLPIGIALIAAGALALVGAVALNSDKVPTQTKQTIAKIVAIAAGALIAIGLILALTGVALPLGIALIAAGALALATTAKLNWGSLSGMVSSVLGTLLAIISAASIVIGVILCLTGAGIPLGIALIMAGIAGTTKAVSVTDNPIVNWVRGIANSVLRIVNWLIGQVNQLHFDIPDWVPGIGGRRFGFNLKYIPYLAQGAVIPPNREFLAVLGDQKQGTNIEAPLDTIVSAFRMVLAEAGGQSIEVNFTGSMAQFIAMLDKEITISRRNRGV